MKLRYVLYSFVLLICIGCRASVVDQSGNLSLGHKIIQIDGCEYLVVENSSNWANNYSITITHKGNCNNPIHNDE